MEDEREVEVQDSHVHRTAIIAGRNTKKDIEVPAVTEIAAMIETGKVDMPLLRKERQFER